MRIFRPVLVCVLAAVTVQAEPPRKGRATPNALGALKEDDTPPAPTAVPATSAADAALLKAILYAFEPAPEEIRVVAVQDLALLGDPRALNVLAMLIFDPNAHVQFTALASLARMQNPRAEEILKNVVRHPQLPELMKVRALQALPFQGTATARAFLSEIATHASVSPAIRSAARQTLQDYQPSYAAPPLPRPISAGNP